MKPAEHMPSLEQALELVMSNTPRLNTIDIALDAAAGRVLAEDVTSDVDLPPFNKSAMDGYAVRAEDVAAVPAELRVVEEIPAGSTPRRALRAGPALPGGQPLAGQPFEGAVDPAVAHLVSRQQLPFIPRFQLVSVAGPLRDEPEQNMTQGHPHLPVAIILFRNIYDLSISYKSIGSAGPSC